MIYNAKYKSLHGEGLKLLTPKQILQRLPIAVVKVKANEIKAY